MTAAFLKTRRFAMRIAFMAALALLSAQFGALGHAYSHDAGLKPVPAHKLLPSSHDFCSDCLAFAPLLSGAGAPSPVPALLAHGAPPMAASGGRALIGLAPRLAFRSRAPPALV